MSGLHMGDEETARRTGIRLANQSGLKVNDIIVSKTEDGHNLSIVTAMPHDRASLVYRGEGWTVQYAVARGAKLAETHGGDLWYTANEFETLEHLGTFRAARALMAVN